MMKERQASPVASLPIAWRQRAAELRTYAADTRVAHAYELVAKELEASLAEHGDAVLSLAAASLESGYSKDHLRRMIREGALENVGRPRAPRLRRRDLPIKPRHAALDAVATDVHVGARERIARLVANSD